MATLNDSLTWIATKMKRSDLADIVLLNAKAAYIQICEAMPFPELQTRSGEIPVTSVFGDTYALDSTTLGAGVTLAGIMSIRLTVNSGSANPMYRRLKRSHTRLYDALGYVVPGDPAMYARFGTSIELRPTPRVGASYTMRIRFWKSPTVTDGTTTLVWANRSWDELLNYEILYRTYLDLDEHDKAQYLIQPQPLPRQGSPRKQKMYEIGILPRLWNDLTRRIDEREGGDEDFSINPLVRRYTAGGR